MWATEREQMRSDLIFARTTVKQEYNIGGNLFRPSKRFDPKPQRKKRVKLQKLSPMYGTMGSYPMDFEQEQRKAKDDYEARHQLPSSSRKYSSRCTLFPKTKRGNKTIKPWGQSYASLAQSVNNLNTFRISKSLASDKFFGTTQRSFIPVVPSADPKNITTDTLMVPTIDGIPQNTTFKKLTIDCKAAFSSLVPRPCAKAFSVVAANSEFAVCCCWLLLVVVGCLLFCVAILGTHTCSN